VEKRARFRLFICMLLFFSAVSNYRCGRRRGGTWAAGRRTAALPRTALLPLAGCLLPLSTERLPCSSSLCGICETLAGLWVRCHHSASFCEGLVALLLHLHVRTGCISWLLVYVVMNAKQMRFCGINNLRSCGQKITVARGMRREGGARNLGRWRSRGGGWCRLGYVIARVGCIAAASLCASCACATVTFLRDISCRRRAAL